MRRVAVSVAHAVRVWRGVAVRVAEHGQTVPLRVWHMLPRLRWWVACTEPAWPHGRSLCLVLGGKRCRGGGHTTSRVAARACRRHHHAHPIEREQSRWALEARRGCV